ncbi:MAG: MlaD family protein [Planctomycetota bacterium]
MKKRSGIVTSFSVGFLFFIAVSVVMAAFFWVGSGRGLTAGKILYRSSLPSTSGLRPGSKVFLGGVPVGAVVRIEFHDDPAVNQVVVTFAVDPSAAPRIRADSRLWLETQGLLGDNSVQVSMGTNDQEVLSAGDEIPFEERTMLEGMAGSEFTDRTEALLATMVGILQQIQTGQGTFGQLLTNSELYENVNSLVTSLDKFSAEVQGITLEVNGMLRQLKDNNSVVSKALFSDEYDKVVTKTLTEIATLVSLTESIVEKVNQGEGSVGKLLTDTAAHDRLVAAITKIETAAARVDETLADTRRDDSVVGRLLRDKEMGTRLSDIVDSLEQSSRSLERVMALLESGEGSAGMLIHDPSIATSMRNLFIGVQDMGYVRALVRNAESIGQEIARGGRLSRQSVDEVERVEKKIREGGDSGDSVDSPKGSAPEPPPEKGGKAPKESGK